MKQFIFGFIIGGSLAGVSTYLIMKKKHEKDLVIKEGELRAYYAELTSPKKAGVIKEEKEEPEEIVKKYHEKAERYFGDSITEEPKEDPAELEHPEDDAPSEYYEEEGDDPEIVKYIEEGMKAHQFDEENRRRAPERIRPDEFGNAPGFDAKEITYYAPDMTYCDEYEEIIDDEVSMFGAAVKEWENNEDDEDYIYIRNYMLSCDYKIEKLMCHCPQNPEV